MVHGVDPVLPFDLAEQTFLSPELTGPLSYIELLTARAKALQR